VERQFSVPKDHPSLVGHFPGNPVVPGVVILDEIFQAIESEWPQKAVSNINFVKFIKPLRAGKRVTLIIEENDKINIKFVCTVNDEIFVSGKCKISEKALP
jgi:3-hydroxyacyl-[acyl-carrier-protein] dehydratase